MRFRRIKDVLDWTRNFHNALAKHYDNLAIGHERDRVGILLYYLAAHERALSEAMKHYEEDEVHDVLDLWYDPDVDLPQDLDSLTDTLQQVNVDEVLKLALRFHDVLIDLYQTLSEKAPTEGIKDLFDNIAGHEVKEKLRVVRDAGRLEDL